MAKSEAHDTSNPKPNGKIASRGGPSLAVQDNANVANFDDSPAVFNNTPAAKKSYGWNKGETGNANG